MTKTFAIKFGFEWLGTLQGRTAVGTLTRYAKCAGLNPADADLKIVEATPEQIATLPRLSIPC